MDKDEIARLIGSRKWLHGFEIAPGIVSPGRVKVDARSALDYYGVEGRLSGRRALDIGARDGPYSFELERRGAEVLAVDIRDPDETGFNVARSIRGSSVRYLRCSVYDLPPELTGAFDLVLFLGVYYHLKNPLLALERIWDVLRADGTLYFEGAVLDFAHNIDGYWRDKSRALAEMAAHPVAYVTAGEFASDLGNWFIPSRACLLEWLAGTGFRDATLIDPPNVEFSRAAGSARKDPTYR
jgi:tRNA (mo5U34)-methyltransferase